MVNKKGLIRVVEATIAILLILGVLIILSSRKEIKQSDEFTNSLPVFLDEIAQNRTARENILVNNESLTESEIEMLLKPRINPSADFSVEICDLEESCFLVPYPDVESDIFSAERIISATINNEEFAPKKLKVFVWKRN